MFCFCRSGNILHPGAAAGQHYQPQFTASEASEQTVGLYGDAVPAMHFKATADGRDLRLDLRAAQRVDDGDRLYFFKPLCEKNYGFCSLVHGSAQAQKVVGQVFLATPHCYLTLMR